MENVARIIITMFFIGLIALAIIFFGVFGLVPLENIGKIGKNNGDTVRVEYVTVEGEKPSEVPSEATTTVPEYVPPEIMPPGSGGSIQPPPVVPQEVTTPSGKIRLDVPPGSPNAPQQSTPITESQVPTGSVRIVMKEGSFVPRLFTIRKGEEVTLAVSSGDDRTHVFMFKDPRLSAIAIGVGPGETRLMKFAAPVAGDFEFFCAVPGHEGAGESGRMTVIE